MWRKYDAISLATPEGFGKSPSLVWQFYHYRREVSVSCSWVMKWNSIQLPHNSALRAAPNKAHLALSAFSLSSFRNQIVPHSTFTLITQNVDGLSARANRELATHNPEAVTASEQVDLIEMHGRLFDVQCTNEKCQYTLFDTSSPICEALSGTEELVEHGTLDPEIDQSTLPRCSKCGDLARPGVVWFGEIPRRMKEIDKLVQKADLCLVIGTSSTVSIVINSLKIINTHDLTGATCCFLCIRGSRAGRKGCSFQFGTLRRRRGGGLSLFGTLRRNIVKGSGADGVG